MVQWFRIYLAMQGTWVQSLVRKISWAREQLSLLPQLPHPCTATTDAHKPRAHASQQEKPPQWEAQAPQLESSPCLLQLEKACMQQWTPTTAKKKKLDKSFFKKRIDAKSTLLKKLKITKIVNMANFMCILSQLKIWKKIWKKRTDRQGLQILGLLHINP